MHLNTLQPAIGAKFVAKRLGRGIGSGLGKTCGKGHKGQKARAGGYHKVGFEGGQTPYKRKVPKFGFVSKKSFTKAELRLQELNKLINKDQTVPLTIDLNILKAANIIGGMIKQVKIIATGELKCALLVTESDALKVTRGAKLAIESLGGKVLVA